MSTCPDMELHSAYLDGEIVSPWYEEIKQHVESCTVCKSHVEKLQSLQTVLAKDSELLNFDSARLEDSYARLQSRLRYTKVAAKSRVVYADFTRKLVPYAAAAVFLAAVILPSASVRSQVKNRFNNVALITPAVSAELLNKTGIVADENINVSAIKVADTASSSVVTTLPAALHVSNLTKVDIFKPELTPASSQINIKLPEVTDKFTDVADLPLIIPEVQPSVYPVSDFYR